MSLLLPANASMIAPGVPGGCAFPPELAARLAVERIVAVITVDKVDQAVPLARALLAGGIQAIELAWRTPAALEALARIIQQVPEMLASMGTLLSPEQVRAAARAGAHFGVSPGLSPAVVRAAREAALPFAPGVQTPSDLHAAVELGCRFLKFFPAETAGGLAHLRSIHAPFAHLGLRYIALGGIDERNAPAYFAEPCIAAVGGSWIVPQSLVQSGAWDCVTKHALTARALVVTHARTLI